MRVKSTNIFIADKVSEMRMTPAQFQWVHIYVLIPPLYYDNRFITDFTEKAELFNLFFSK